MIILFYFFSKSQFLSFILYCFISWCLDGAVLRISDCDETKQNTNYYKAHHVRGDYSLLLHWMIMNIYSKTFQSKPLNIKSDILHAYSKCYSFFGGYFMIDSHPTIDNLKKRPFQKIMLIR